MTSPQILRMILISLIFIFFASPLYLPHFQMYFDENAGILSEYRKFSFYFVVLLYIISYLICVINNIDQRFRIGWLLVWFFIFSGMVVIFQFSPAELPMFISAPLIYLVFANLVATLFATIIQAGPLVSFVMLPLIVLFPFINDFDHSVPTAKKADINSLTSGVWEEEVNTPCVHGPRPSTSCIFLNWLANRPDLEQYRKTNRPYPVFLVSAAGGGIYAAANANTFLEHANSLCPSFAQHTFAISGVSGGAFGALAFSALESTSAPVSTLPKCGGKFESSQNDFSQDFFTPIIASFVFGNIVQAYSPISLNLTRSGDSLSLVFKTFLSKQKHFDKLLSKSWSPKNISPALIFGSFDVSTGKNAIFSPFPVIDDSAHFYSQLPLNHARPNMDLTLGSAASLSARFAFVTPSGSFATHRLIDVGSGDHHPNIKNRVSQIKKIEKRHIFVDGGYIDNSGIDAKITLLEMLQKYSARREECEKDDCKFEMHDGNEFYNCNSSHLICDYFSNLGRIPPCEGVHNFEGCKPSYGGSWDQNIVPVEIVLIRIDSRDSAKGIKEQSILDPLFALENARAVRGELYRQKFRYQYCGTDNCHDFDDIFIEHILKNDEAKIPLGWTMSQGHFSNVKSMLGTPEKCSIHPHYVAPKNEPEHNTENHPTFVDNNCAIFRIQSTLTAGPTTY